LANWSSYGFYVTEWRVDPMPCPDRHNEIELNCVHGGKMAYLLGSEVVTLTSGRLSVFWGILPHQIIRNDSAQSLYWLTIPLPWFLQWELPVALRNPVLNGQLILEPDLTRGAADLSLFRQWMDDYATCSPERRKCIALEVESRLRRLAIEYERSSQMTPRSNGQSVHDLGRLDKVEEIAVFIAKNYTEPLTIQQVAASVGLSASHAMALFQRCFGRTIVRFINEHRVSHAQRLLATTDSKVITIAGQSGFGSLSRFNAVFKEMCGQTPSEYRRSISAPA
jgi:AraC-like DNA-binding protein